MNVDKLIVKTFKKAVNMMVENPNPELRKNSNSDFPPPKIIYPCYSDGEKRISEQEIKQLFIQTLIEEKNFYFSVETPTELKYKFSEDRKLIDPLVGIGESANVDLCLYKFEDSKFKRMHLIEFKFKNSAEHEIKKDFLKLFAEGSEQNNYFIHILDSANKGTLKKATEQTPKEKRTSVLQKYYNSWTHCINQKEHCKVCNINSKNKITIYLLIINNKNVSSDCYKIELPPKSCSSTEVFDLEYYKEPLDSNQHDKSLHFWKFKQKN